MKSSIEFRKYINADGLLVSLPQILFDEMKGIISSRYPKEFGGIFIGKINSYCAEIQSIEVPEKYVSGPVQFIRKPGSLNKKLKHLYKYSRGESYYLGEWHSHPDCSPFPSTRDFDSMRNIAENANVRIKTPLLLILSINKKSQCNEQFYLYSESKLKKYNLLK